MSLCSHEIWLAGNDRGEIMPALDGGLLSRSARMVAMTYGRLDVAFNNAGTLGEAGPSTGVSEADWSDAIASLLHRTLQLPWRAPRKRTNSPVGN